MATKRWLDRQLLLSLPLDVPGWSMKVHLITWLDGSRCVQVMKYATLHRTTTAGRPYTIEAPYKPMQYVQIPLPRWSGFLAALVRSTARLLLRGGPSPWPGRLRPSRRLSA